MKNDYGYFGKGTEGYIHYMQAQEEISGKKRGRGSRRGGGCLGTLLIVCISVSAPLLLCRFFIV